MSDTDSSPDDTGIPAPPMPLGLVATMRFPCVGCGKRTVTIGHGRCVNCLGKPMAFCPWCSRDIAPEVEFEVASRWRAASYAVNDAWVSEGMYGRYRTRERVLAAREAARRGEDPA